MTALIADALRLTGLRTKREVVETGLRALVRLARQADIRSYRGRLEGVDGLDSMRIDGGHDKRRHAARAAEPRTPLP